MAKFTIDKAGLLTTVQDKGRWGYQQFGMSVAGAMDQFSLSLANLLVGRDRGDAALECTFLGPDISFDCQELIAITGADMEPKLNGQPAPMWASIPVKPGDKLSLGSAKSGLRTYIAFSRGLELPMIMGSRSTFIRGKLGGLKGDKLEPGDEIPLGDKQAETLSYLPREEIPVYKKHATIRVVLGPQDDYFTKEAIETFLSSSYSISSDADRMGYRLEGPIIDHKDGADIISDGIVFGSVQVPGHGSPILMMADRQTTGGYTKIATVVSADLNLLAQMGPGWTMDFRELSLDEARKSYLDYEDKLSKLEEKIKKLSYQPVSTRKFSLNFQGKDYLVEVEEIDRG